MGMSASQARLLSITARLTNNEFRAQTITDRKLRLAEQSSDASKEYMDALNSQKLVFGTYDSNGDRTYTSLTPNLLFTYGDLKNQYSIVNSAGQVLLNGSDIKKYESSQSMADFLYQYGLAKTDNPKYLKALDDIFGENYEEFFNEESPYGYTRQNGSSADGAYLEYVNKLGQMGPLTAALAADNLGEETYNSTIQDYLNALQSAGLVGGNKSLGGFFEGMVNWLNNPPEYAPYPGEFTKTPPNLLDYANSLLSPQCWSSTGIESMRGENDVFNDSFTATNDNIWHMEHVLAQYLWSSQDGSFALTYEGKKETMTNNGSTWAMSSGGGNGEDPMKVRDVLDKYENQELKEKLTELYYKIALHIKDNNSNGGLTSGSITNDGKHTTPLKADITKSYYELINELLVAVAEDIVETKDERYNGTALQGYREALDEYEQAYKEYMKKVEEYNKFKNTLEPWIEKSQDMITKYEELISKLPVRKIPDENDAKYRWYVNLWYRMGGEDESRKSDTKKYKELDENLLNNAEWLEFALEHGVVTMEHAEYDENGSTIYPNMGSFDWKSIIYTNASDIISQDDEVAIAAAEAKYKTKIDEIEHQDKKYDQDLKKLDTEHSALQTEYDSIKEVISKNVERSFKAFS